MSLLNRAREATMGARLRARRLGYGVTRITGKISDFPFTVKSFPRNLLPYAKSALLNR